MKTRPWYLNPWLHVALILVVASFFRLWQIGSIPPGLFGDEATDGLDALDVLAGRGAIFFPANFGREGLHIWIVAGMFHLMGVNPLALRLPSVIAGILTVLATYWLGRDIVRYWVSGIGYSRRETTVGRWRTEAETTHTQFLPPPYLGLIPLLASLYLASSFWHVHFSRFGVRGVFTPLFGTLAFAAFWRAVNLAEKQRSRGAGTQNPSVPAQRPPRASALAWFALSGLFLGLSLHFYTASRFFPFFLGGFLVLQMIIARGTGRPDEAILRRHFWGIVVLFLVAALVFAPLAMYFLQHSGSFTQRASEVVATRAADPLGRMAQASIANVLQFFVPGHGDTEQFYNLPGRAVFDPVSAILALVGIATLLWRWKRPTALFLLTWFAVLLAPAFLATDRWPTLPRVLGVIPGVYFFPAIGILAVVSLLGPKQRDGEVERQRQSRSAGERALSPFRLSAPLLLCIVALVAHAGFTCRDYFRVWGPSQATFDAFEGDMAAASDWLRNNRPPGHVYLSSDIYRHPTFMLLSEQATVQTYFQHYNPDLSWFDARAALPLPPAGEGTTYLIGSSAAMAARATSLLGPNARELDRVLAPDGSAALTVIELPSAGQAESPVSAAGPISFTDQLALANAQVDRGTDGAPWLVLVWQTAGPSPDEYEAYLLEVAGIRPNGDPWQDDMAFDAFRPPEWTPGGSFITWHKLNVPEAQPLREIRLRLLHPRSREPVIQPGAPDGWHAIRN